MVFLLLSRLQKDPLLMVLKRYHPFLYAMLIAIAVGCSNETSPATSKSGHATAQPPTASTSFNSPSLMASPPTTSTSTASEGKKPSLAQALAEVPKDDPSLKPLDTAYKSAAAALQASPTSSVLMKQFTNAAYAYGSKIEYGSSLGTVVRYRASLYVYQAALKVNPNDAKCKKEADQIIAIYQEMGEQVPS